MSSKNSIAITGSGAVCGAGLGIDAIWQNILAGKSAVGPIEQWDARRWRYTASTRARDRLIYCA